MLITEQLSAVQVEEPVKRVPPHVIQIGVLATVQARLPLPEHRKHLLIDSREECTQVTSSPGLFGHASRACGMSNYPSPSFSFRKSRPRRRL